ncbi:MAG TPA: immune inhibitor A domain-containing protein [Pyrinomonadaceae bacterium]|jgi:immune inhibitor A
MKFASKRLAPSPLAALLLILSIFAPSVSLSVNAQIYRQDDDASEGLNLVQNSTDETEDSIKRDGDNFKSPKAAERDKRRQEALKQKIAGKKINGKVQQVAKGQYVEMSLERNDRVFVILAEYGNQTATTAGIPTYNGPIHNEMPEPNRALDNNTIWQADYDRAHFEDIYFNQMVNYYQTQSSGRYTINGSVTEWVKVPFNGARYGNNGLGDAAAWTFIADAVNIWTRDQLAAGKTLQEVTDYLKTFDKWDRYDYDNDGNFDEPDGYIDHFQIVHSGAGEETGGGAQGANAIWSHRWQAWYNFATVTGPSFNKDGGVEFGGGWGANPNGGTFSSSGAAVKGINTTNAGAATVQDAYAVNHTGIYVGDYTVQPENGGLGVFAHEYGHDLGLPDHYDTNGGDNSTGFWTIMSSGSYLGSGQSDIGSNPGDFGAWDKIQLGWSNFDTASTGVYSEHKLGPAETNTKKAQAVIVTLPPDKNDLFLYDPSIGALQYGTYAWWGGKADSGDTTLTRTITVPGGTSTLNMRLNYQIESNWDYAYVQVSNNGGASWTNLAGTYTNASGTQSALTTTTNPNSKNLGNGITGSTANATNAPNGWRLASFNLTPYANQSVQLRLRYKTDEYTTLNGFLADEITLNGVAIDNAENGANGWTPNGFKATNGLEKTNAAHYYIAEYRQYRTYDEGLKTGPYTFGRITPYGNWVDHYPYQDGLLVTYWDTTQANNNTSLHRGEGLILPIDAHPEPLRRRQLPMGGGLWNFAPWTSRIQAFDSTFGLKPTDAISIPFRGTLTGAVSQPESCLAPVTTGTAPNTTTTTTCGFLVNIPSLPAVTEFNDNNTYWYAETAAAGVIVPKTGTTIRVINTSAQGSFMKIEVNSALAPVTQ